MKKSLISLIVVAIILVIAVAIYKNNHFESDSNSIKIGVLEPLTGSAAYYGETAKKGIDLAAEQLKQEYPNLKLEIYHEDNKFNPKVGVDAYNSLKARYKLDAIMTQTSPVTLAIQPLAKNDNIPQMAVTSSADKYSSPNDLSFRMSAKTILETKTMADYIQKHYKNIAIIYMNNDTGVANAETLKENLSSDPNVKIAINEAFPTDSTDFRSVIAKMKVAKVDAVYVAGLATHISIALKQMKELSLQVPTLSFRTGEDPTLIKTAGALAEGVIFTSNFDPDKDTKEVKDFVLSYQNKYHEIPDGYSAEGYQGLMFLGQAFAKCGRDNECIKGYLLGLKDVPSIFGNVSYDENGDISYGFYLKTVKDGKFVKLEQ